MAGSRRPRQERLELEGVDAAHGARRVRRGVDSTVRALKSTGRLETVDDALVALARTLADAIDDEHSSPDGSRFTVSALAGRLHPIVQDLRGHGGPEDLDLFPDLAAGSLGDAPLP